MPVLDLSGRELVTLPDSIGQLTDLRILDLSDNEFSGLPESIGSLPSLQEVNLVGNDLSVSQATRIQARVPDSTRVFYRPYRVGDRSDYEWYQTAHVSAPVEGEGVFRALLEASVRTLRSRDSLQVQQSPADSQSVVVAELQHMLDENHDLDVASANRVRIEYEWGKSQSQFQREIASVQFFHRETGWFQDGADVPVLYLSADANSFLRSVLIGEGYLPPRTHYHPGDTYPVFIDQLAFARIQSESDVEIVRIGERSADEIDTEQKRQLVQKVGRLTRESGY
jgi:hypothetical protein